MWCLIKLDEIFGFNTIIKKINNNNMNLSILVIFILKKLILACEHYKYIF